MYRAFFGFREKPFNLTPDPKFLYLNASYREALAALHYGVVERKGFVSLIGEAGTGKTTLLRRLLAELPRETRSVLVINPAIGFEEMLRFILSDLGRPPTPGATKLDMLEVLNTELLDTLARGGNVVVLIDEAQDLTIPVLEELRLLSNLETAKEKILQLVIAGQPELDGLLARPEIRQLRQRISVRARLRPLARGEVKAYVGARIAAAGGDVRGLFTNGALFRLWWFSGGVPRLVNVACDNALVNAYAAGRRTIRWGDIGEAMRDLRRQVSWAPGPWKTVAALVTAVVIGGALVLAGLRMVRGGEDHGSVASPTAPVPPVPHRTTAPVVVPPPAPPPPTATVEVPASPAVAITLEASSSPTATPVGGAASATPGATFLPSSTSTPEPSKPTASPDAGPTALPSAVLTTAVVPTPPIPTVQPVPSAAPSLEVDADVAAAREVRVNAGDNLSEIAVRYYGSASPRVLAAIRAANPWLEDPNVIGTGQRLILPSEAPPSASTGVP